MSPAGCNACQQWHPSVRVPFMSELGDCARSFVKVHSYFSAQLFRCSHCETVWLVGYYEEFGDEPTEWGDRTLIARPLTPERVAEIERAASGRPLDIDTFAAEDENTGGLDGSSPIEAADPVPVPHDKQDREHDDMSEFTLWAVKYRSDDGEGIAGKYVDEDQAEESRQAVEARGLDAWIEEEQWAFGANGPVRIDGRRAGDQHLHRAWLRLIGSLADTLVSLTAGQSLSLHSASEHWVQFRAVQDGLRAEAVSNAYLDEDNQLDPDQEDALEALGWLPPFDDDGIERAQNFYREFPGPVPVADVAALAVHTLAEVYEVGYPQDLTYLAFDGNKPRSERDLSFPDLGVGLYRSDDEVGGVLTNNPVFDTQEHLLDALREITPDLEQWGNGEMITIRCGSVPVSIQVTGDPPIVRMWSPVLAEVTETVHLLRELNDINTQVSFARLSITPEGTVVGSAEFHGLPFVGKHLLSVLTELARLTDSLDERLRVRHGGTPIVAPSPASNDPTPAAG